MHSISTRLATLVRAHGPLALALLMSACFVADASAHTRVIVADRNGDGLANEVTVRYFSNFLPFGNCIPNATYRNYPTGPDGPGVVPFLPPDPVVYSPQLNCPGTTVGDPSAWSRHGAFVLADGPGGVAGTVSTTCRTTGWVYAGGELGTQAFRTDTSFVVDSILFRINRSGTTVTLNNFSGEIRAHRPNNKAYTRGMFSIRVYPTQAAADADTISDNGTGAAFVGHVELRSDGNVVPMRGFGAADFVVENNNGSFRARPAAGLSKSITVPNANTAVVVIISDPRGDHTPRGADVPGASPFGLVLLSLAMLAGGAWLLRRRAGSAAAA